MGWVRVDWHPRSVLHSFTQQRRTRHSYTICSSREFFSRVFKQRFSRNQVWRVRRLYANILATTHPTPQTGKGRSLLLLPRRDIATMRSDSPDYSQLPLRTNLESAGKYAIWCKLNIVKSDTEVIVGCKTDFMRAVGACERLSRSAN